MIDFTRSGRMISPSKTLYHQVFPDNEVYFNANLCTKEQGKLWYGDIDLTRERDALQAYADQLGQQVFLLREIDGRFDREQNLPFDRAVATFVPKNN